MTARSTPPARRSIRREVVETAVQHLFEGSPQNDRTRTGIHRAPSVAAPPRSVARERRRREFLQVQVLVRADVDRDTDDFPPSNGKFGG